MGGGVAHFVNHAYMNSKKGPHDRLKWRIPPFLILELFVKRLFMSSQACALFPCKQQTKYISLKRKQKISIFLHKLQANIIFEHSNNQNLLMVIISKYQIINILAHILFSVYFNSRILLEGENWYILIIWKATYDEICSSDR